MATHDVETLTQGVAVVLLAVATGEETDNDGRDTPQGELPPVGLFHHTDAPVYVCRMVVAEVVSIHLGDVGTCIERLMAHQHAVTERAPRELFGW